LRSCPGPQPFQSGAPSRHPPGLQTKALRRVGRVERPRGLIAAWVCACCAQRRRPAVALTKPKPGLRPVALPDDPRAIVSACEAQPFAIETNVKEYDTFWIKSQPYSLRQLLNGNFVEKFLGGTVY